MLGEISSLELSVKSEGKYYLNCCYTGVVVSSVIIAPSLPVRKLMSQTRSKNRCSGLVTPTGGGML